jgi:hypothetical protein
MPDPKRVEFITRHFKDLQSIRFAPVPALMLLAPLLTVFDGPHISRATALAILLSLLFCIVGVVGFYWWSTAAIKRRYGSVRLSRDEAYRMQQHPVIFVLYLIMGAVMFGFYFFAPRPRHPYVYSVFILLITMLRTILDSTNPASRRLVWTIGLVVLFGPGSFLILSGVDGGVVTCLLGGVVWLSISIFDFLLLRRTFAEISGSPSSGATDPVAHYG